LGIVEKLPSALDQHLLKLLDGLINGIFHARCRPSVTIEELAELVQDAYQTAADLLNSSNDLLGWLDFPTNFYSMQSLIQKLGAKPSIDEILNEFEQVVCFSCYDLLFCPATISEEEIEDLSLQERIRSLHWVTYGFLESGILLDNATARECFDCAVTGRFVCTYLLE